MTNELSNSGIPQDRVAVLVAIYREAAVKLRGILLAPPGKTDKSRVWSQSRASEQLHQVEQLIVNLQHSAAAWIGDSRDGSPGPVHQAVADGIARGITQAKEAGVDQGDGLRGSFSRIDRRTVELFAQEIYADLKKGAVGMGESAKKVLRQTAQLKLPESDLDKILAGGVIAGKPAETIRTLREALQVVHGDTVTIQDKNGDLIHYPAGYYASLVVRTKTREATVHARHDRLEALDLDLVSIIGRISKNFCTAFLGQVFSLGGKSSKYPSYANLPNGGAPFHPNCSKSTRPFIEELASGKQLEMAEGHADADQLLGDDSATAQRKFKDLQLYQQVKDSYATTAKKLFGPGSKAA